MMKICWFFSVLVVCFVLSVVVQCEVDRRRDVHRIVLKKIKSKKQKPKDFHNDHHHYHDVDYEPQAHSTNYHSREVFGHHHFYDKPRFNEHRGHQHNHDDYQDLVKPRPPKRDDYIISYPEEEPTYEYQEAASNHFFVPHVKPDVLDNWSPMTVQTNPVIKKQPSIDYPEVAKPKKKKKKPRRKTTDKPHAQAIQASHPKLADFPTTVKPRKYTEASYVNLHQNNKSIKYEVHNMGAKHYESKKILPRNKKQHSYEVYEDLEDKFSKSGLNVSPLSSYSYRGPFLPTVTPLYIPKEGRKKHI